MQQIKPDHILEQPFDTVKTDPSPELSSSSDSMIHHNSSTRNEKKKHVLYKGYGCKAYGVSRSRRVLSPGLLLKHFDVIRTGLRTRLGFTPAQVEAIMRLLRLWAYYGAVFPSAAQLTGEPDPSPATVAWRAEQGLGPAKLNYGTSRATFWRAIKRLQDLGLIEVVNRYIIRPHAQISNLYRLDRLIVVLARYISERRELALPDWLTPSLTMPPRLFWAFLTQSPEARSGPIVAGSEGF